MPSFDVMQCSTVDLAVFTCRSSSFALSWRVCVSEKAITCPYSENRLGVAELCATDHGTRFERAEQLLAIEFWGLRLPIGWWDVALSRDHRRRSAGAGRYREVRRLDAVESGIGHRFEGKLALLGLAQRESLEALFHLVNRRRRPA